MNEVLIEMNLVNCTGIAKVLIWGEETFSTEDQFDIYLQHRSRVIETYQLINKVPATSLSHKHGHSP